MNGVGDLVRADTDEVEVLKAFLSSVFPKVSQDSLLREWIKKVIPHQSDCL